MDSLVIKDQNLIKILHNVFPNSLEYLLFYIDQDKFEINGSDKAKSLFCQFTLEKKSFDNYNVKNTHIMPILTKQFNDTIGSITSKFLKAPSITIQFDVDKNINILISDKNETGGININKQIRAVQIIKSEGFGIPNLPKFEDAPFCSVENPEYLRSVYNSFPGVDMIEISIGNNSITFKGRDELETSSEVKIKARFFGSGSSKILLDSFKHASNICELKSINRSRISISKDGIVNFSYNLENAVVNYFLSKATE